MSIEQAFREQRNSAAGRIVIAGSVLNLLLAAFHAWQAYDVFPGPDAEGLAASALLCAAVPVALVGTWVDLRRRLRYRRNAWLTALLLLIAAAPSLSWIFSGSS